ncbi:MAG TPA: hypothetical protein VH186_37370 [Chloroflexia bacterium]|nr:hypothetical protein [Chloroflexia bacterium]
MNETVPEIAKSFSFEVILPAPLDPATSLEMFRRNGDDLLDRWDGITFRRTLPVEGRFVPFICTFKGDLFNPVACVTITNPEDRPAVEEGVKNTFVASPPDFEKLLAVDPILARLEMLYPGVRQVRQPDLLTCLVRCISAQQVNLRWAAVTRRRLAEAYGDIYTLPDGETVYSLNAEKLAGATVASIRQLQFTTRKAEYIIGCSEAIASGALSGPELEALPDEGVINRLTALRGIGVWTAEWVLARGLGRPTVVAGDLGVRKAVGMAYLNEPLPPESSVRQATAHWGHAGSAAQALLLHGLANNTLTC